MARANQQKTPQRGPAPRFPAVCQALRAMLVYAVTIGVALPLPAAWRLTQRESPHAASPGAAQIYAFMQIISPRAEAASYQDANMLYQKGDLKGAEQMLKRLLVGHLGKAAQAQAFKLLGICQFLENNKTGAAKSFKSALARDASLKIDSSEVLDSAVISFFSSQKTSVSAKSADAAGAGALAPAAAPRSVDASGRPLKQTFLKVTSNVAAANVAIDGIIAGQANTLINTDPGRVLVEVTAPGYLSQQVYVNVAKDRENVINITLEVPKPKPAAPPKAAPPPKATPAATSGSLATLDAPGPAATSRGTAKTQRRSKNAAYAPTPTTDMFGETGARPGAPNNGPAAAAPAGPDLSDKFAVDSGAAAPPAYAGGYGAQPGYAAQPQGQYYAPPPQYYAPPQQYYAPPQQQYYPPPPPPPPGDPYSGYQDPGVPGQMPATPSLQTDPASRDEFDDEKSGKNTLITLLPFGAGQIQNRRYILGVAFLGLESGALYYWYSKSNLADSTVADTNAYYQANCADPNAVPPGSAADSVCKTFVQSRQTYVNQQRQSAQYGLIGFGVLYVGGVVEAMLDDGAPQASAKKKKKKKKRRYGGFSTVSPVGSSADDLPEPRRDLYSFDWHLDVVPAYAAERPQGENVKPALNLDLRWHF